MTDESAAALDPGNLRSILLYLNLVEIHLGTQETLAVSNSKWGFKVWEI